MDYSGLVTSIKEGDHLTTGKLCAEATPILKKYLIRKYGATPEDADDAIQKMYEYIILKIREDEIENPKGVLAYMLKACKHNYLKMKQEMNSFDRVEPENGELLSGPNQLWALVNEEEQEILKACLRQLRKGYREFISYWFTYPDERVSGIYQLLVHISRCNHGGCG